MAIHDHDGTASYQIRKIFDHDGTASYQIGKVYDHDGTASYQIYSAEETKSTSVTATSGWDNSYGPWAYASISIPVGETFRIDKISWTQYIYTNIQIVVTINNGATTVYSYQQTTGSYVNHNYGPYPSSGYYTSTTAANSVRIGIRGWRSSPSWADGVTKTETATLNITVGV